MSATPPVASPAPVASGGPSQTASPQRAQSRQAGGPVAPTDLFSSLLSLLSAPQEAPLDGDASGLASRDEPPQTDTSALPGDSGHPLAGLLGWAGAPGLLALSGGDGARAVQTGRELSAVTARSAAPGEAQGAIALPEGMTLLAQPEAADADTLAALGTPGGGMATEAARPFTPSRAPAWRSTAGWSGAAPVAASAGSAMATTAAGQVSVTVRQGAVETAAAPALATRSTVTLDERFTAAAGVERERAVEPSEHRTGLAGHDAVPAAADPASLSGGAGGQEGGDTPQPQLSDSGPTGEETAAQAPDDDSAGSGWGAQHLRHASVRVGEPGEQAIDIQLSMAGQEVRVDIRTDDAQALASLAQDGGASLGDLLQRSGIELGGLSLGAQTGGQGGQGAPSQRSMPPASPATRGAASVDSTSRTAASQPPRADGSRPLDLFV